MLNPRAAGCHRLIREGAALVERPEEVLELLAPALRQQLPGLQSRLATPLNRHRAPARWPTTLTTSACGGPWTTTQAVWIH